jgi:predicted kinase
MKSLSLTTPNMIIMVCIPGSGKSFFAHQFGNTFHAPVVSSDLIAALTGTNASTIAKLAYYQIGELLKTRQSIIVDGLAANRAERSELLRRAQAAGYEPLYIWIQTDAITAKMRVTKDKTRPAAQRSVEEYDKLLQRFVEPSPAEQAIVLSGKHTYATQARIVLKKLSAPRAEAATQDTLPQRTDPVSAQRSARNITVR